MKIEGKEIGRHQNDKRELARKIKKERSWRERRDWRLFACQKRKKEGMKMKTYVLFMSC
jgi:hypothetical protein